MASTPAMRTLNTPVGLRPLQDRVSKKAQPSKAFNRGLKVVASSHEDSTPADAENNMVSLTSGAASAAAKVTYSAAIAATLLLPTQGAVADEYEELLARTSGISTTSLLDSYADAKKPKKAKKGAKAAQPAPEVKAEGAYGRFGELPAEKPKKKAPAAKPAAKQAAPAAVKAKGEGNDLKVKAPPPAPKAAKQAKPAAALPKATPFVDEAETPELAKQLAGPASTSGPKNFVSKAAPGAPVGSTPAPAAAEPAALTAKKTVTKAAPAAAPVRGSAGGRSSKPASLPGPVKFAIEKAPTAVTPVVVKKGLKTAASVRPKDLKASVDAVEEVAFTLDKQAVLSVVEKAGDVYLSGATAESKDALAGALQRVAASADQAALDRALKATVKTGLGVNKGQALGVAQSAAGAVAANDSAAASKTLSRFLDSLKGGAPASLVRATESVALLAVVADPQAVVAAAEAVTKAALSVDPAKGVAFVDATKDALFTLDQKAVNKVVDAVGKSVTKGDAESGRAVWEALQAAVGTGDASKLTAALDAAAAVAPTVDRTKASAAAAALVDVGLKTDTAAVLDALKVAKAAVDDLAPGVTSQVTTTAETVVFGLAFVAAFFVFTSSASKRSATEKSLNSISVDFGRSASSTIKISRK